jgi:photosystem II stability/assembly factor-like uncharacterized protein
MLKHAPLFLIALISCLFMRCEKPEPDVPLARVQPPQEMQVLKGNNQIGGYNRELYDTIIIKIKPKDPADVSKYDYVYSGSNAVGKLNWIHPEIKNGELYVSAVWETGSQPRQQEIKFYLLANCGGPFKTSPCNRIDSVTVSAVIKEPWSTAYSGKGNLQDIHFTSAQNALAVGDDFGSGIVRTTDGGNTWSAGPAFRHDLYQLRFLNSTTGLVTVTNNFAYFTYDGGASFVAEGWTPPTVGHLSSTDFFMITRNTIYSVGYQGKLLKTTDGGKTWQKYNGFSFINGLQAITCLDENTCYACGDVGKVVKTSNGGKDWQEYELLLNNQLNAIYFLDKDHGFCGGQSGVFIRTTNGGETWDMSKTGLKFNIISIRFFNRQHGLVVSRGGEIAETNDGGKTWKLVCVSGNGVYEITKAFIRDAKTVFAIQRNTIFKYDLAQ